MAQGYSSPGVRVSEDTNLSLVSNLAAPAFVCLVGTASGKQATTERVTLPGLTTTVGIQVLPVGTLNVVSTNDFPSTGTVTVGTQSVAYTGKTATTFTGATGGTGSQAAGTTVSADVAYTLAKTGVDTTSFVVKKTDTLAVINAGNYSVAQSSDPNTSVVGDEIYTLSRVPAPLTAPTIVTGAGGNPSGTYVYALAFVRGTGFETGLSVDSSPITLTSQQGTVTIIIGPAGTTARHVYRKRTSVGGDNIYHLVGVVAGNATTSFTDNVLNTSAEVSGQPLGQVGATPVTGLSIGDSLLVSYSYTDANYYTPTLVQEYSDVVVKYGDAFDAAGGVNSALSLAARFAFSNGASEVVCQASATTSSVDFGLAFDKLKNELNIGFVVPISGSTAIHALAAAHVSFMSQQGQYRFAVVGQDGSTTTITPASLRVAAQAYNSENVIHISPSSFKITNPVSGNNAALGSQYMAAAVAGRFAGQDAQFPLTRRVLAGFSGGNEVRYESDKVLDKNAGLMVIEDRATVLRCYQGVTTSTLSVNTSEASVVRAKYELIRVLINGLDSLIGLAGDPATVPGSVAARVSSLLEQVKQRGTIASYSGVSARALQGDPTTIEVRFSYVPIYPINNIEIRFSIDTQSGLFSIQQ